MNERSDSTWRADPTRRMAVTARGPGPSAAGTSTPRPGQGAGRDRTPSPVPPGPPAAGLPAQRALDPRWYQLAMLSALLLYGMLGVGFDQTWSRIVLVVAAALATQFLCGWLWRLPRFEPLSALITGIGLATLLRTNDHETAMKAAAIAIAGKFLVRWRGRHLFNPTNLALVAMLASGAGWVSPGQYGHAAFVALLIVCVGLTVVGKAGRSDVTLAFLAVHAAILFGRSLWLGEPLAIPLHRLQSGLLLQFAFNMISDPRTTPDSRAGRVLFGALVAVGAGFVQFVLFGTNGPLWALAACAPLVPLINLGWPGPRHRWDPHPATAGATPEPAGAFATAARSSRGEVHETPVPALPVRRRRLPAAVRHAVARLRT